MEFYDVKNSRQLELIEGRIEMKEQPAKRVNIVSLKLVRESSILYKERQIKSPDDANKLFKQFLIEADREYFRVICHVGSLNSSIVHPRR